MREDRSSFGRRVAPATRRFLIRLAMVGGLAALMLVISVWWHYRLAGAEQVQNFVSEQRRQWTIVSFARDAPDVPAGTVVFLGSSTFYRFPLKDAYPGAPWLNRGLGADTFAGLLARLDASLPAARPAGIVVYCGANDVRAFRLPPAQVLADAEALLAAIEARFPSVPVAIVEALPAVRQWPEETAALDTVNAGLRELARSRGASFVRTARPPIVDAPGRLSARIAVADGIHLDQAGYAVLAAWIAEDGGAATAELRTALASR